MIEHYPDAVYFPAPTSRIFQFSLCLYNPSKIRVDYVMSCNSQGKYSLSPDRGQLNPKESHNVMIKTQAPFDTYEDAQQDQFLVDCFYGKNHMMTFSLSTKFYDPPCFVSVIERPGICELSVPDPPLSRRLTASVARRTRKADLIVRILYCVDDYLFPLSSLYYATSSHRLVSPLSITEQSCVFLDPQSSFAYDFHSAMESRGRSSSSFICPLCHSYLVASTSSSTSAMSFVLRCRFCQWNSASVGISSPSPADIATVVLGREKGSTQGRIFDDLVEHFSLVSLGKKQGEINLEYDSADYNSSISKPSSQILSLKHRVDQFPRQANLVREAFPLRANLLSFKLKRDSNSGRLLCRPQLISEESTLKFSPNYSAASFVPLIRVGYPLPCLRYGQTSLVVIVLRNLDATLPMEIKFNPFGHSDPSVLKVVEMTSEILLPPGKLWIGSANATQQSAPQKETFWMMNNPQHVFRVGRNEVAVFIRVRPLRASGDLIFAFEVKSELLGSEHKLFSSLVVNLGPPDC